MTAILRTLCLALMLLAARVAGAQVDVFACEPEWGALAQEIGGARARVYVATTALQDPHRVEARPSLIARARRADLLVCTGAELEAGWLPMVLAQAANGRIQPGAPGYLEAAQLVARIEVPPVLDRSLGDLHAAGNPHIHLDPRNVAKVATALAERFARTDSANADEYRNRSRAFEARWAEAIARWEKEAGPLKGMKVVVYHRNLSYLFRWLGLVEAGSLEPKPGIPPSTAHLSVLVARMKTDPAKLIAYATYQDPRAAAWLAERSGIPALQLPYTVGGTERAKDLFGLFDDTIARLLAAAK